MALFTPFGFMNGSGSSGGPAYVECLYTISASGTGWQTYTVNASIPVGAVVEVICRNSNTGNEEECGVRGGDSTDATRYFDLQAAKDANAYTTCRMFANVNSSRQIDGYAEDTTYCDWLIVGYWTGVAFVEDFSLITLTASEDGLNNWYNVGDLTTPFTGSANAVGVIAFTNNSPYEQECGVRKIGSGLSRIYDIGRQQYGGLTCNTMTVQLDGSGEFEISAEYYLRCIPYYLGEFTEGLEFVEAVQTLTDPTVNDTWTDRDLSAYLDEDGRTVDMHCLTRTAAGNNMGFREKGNTDSRKILIGTNGTTHDWGWEACTKTDSDGILQIVASDVTAASVLFKYMGYYKPSA